MSIAAESGAWAEVRTQSRVIRYRRTGTGRPLLVLGAPRSPDPLWEAVLGAFGAFRRVEPEPPADEADPAAWIADFLEGIGATEVTVLAGGRFGAAALELTSADAQQVSRVVVVAGGVPDAPPGAP